MNKELIGKQLVWYRDKLTILESQLVKMKSHPNMSYDKAGKIHILEGNIRWYCSLVSCLELVCNSEV